MKRYAERLLCILFCGTVALLSLLFFFMPRSDFSETENRALKQCPDFSAEQLFSGEYTANVNDYFADQFPFRNFLVKLKGASELALLKRENNGVLYGRRQLAVKEFDAYRSRIEVSEDTDRIWLDSTQAQLNAVNSFAEKLDIPMVTLVPPRTVDVVDPLISYDRPDGDLLFTQLEDTLIPTAGYIDLLELYRGSAAAGEYVYYRTDHHWTTAGAYTAYCEVMRALGKGDDILAKDRFSIEQIADFSGTTAARAGVPFYEEDVLELWHLPDDDAYTVTVDGKNIGGFYQREYLESSDKYAVFLDGTHNLTTITLEGEARETLLIAKDSFANCLIPFLARHYDIVAVNLHTCTDLSALIETYAPDALLIVCNAENLITTGDLGNLR